MARNQVVVGLNIRMRSNIVWLIHYRYMDVHDFEAVCNSFLC